MPCAHVNICTHVKNIMDSGNLVCCLAFTLWKAIISGTGIPVSQLGGKWCGQSSFVLPHGARELDGHLGWLQGGRAALGTGTASPVAERCGGPVLPPLSPQLGSCPSVCWLLQQHACAQHQVSAGRESGPVFGEGWQGARGQLPVRPGAAAACGSAGNPPAWGQPLWQCSAESCLLRPGWQPG